MNLEGRILGDTSGGSYSQPASLGPPDPFLAYLTRVGIPYLCAEQNAPARHFVPTPKATKAGDAIIALIGRMHAHGIMLRRLHDQWPYDSIKRRADERYFALVDKTPVLARPEAFVLVDAAYLEKYFGQKIELERELHQGICHELFFALGGSVGRLVDPTPNEHYLNSERARRAQLYLTAFREACPSSELTTMHFEMLRQSAFPQFRDPNYNPFGSR